ncbi:MAG TPA: hypothetical protein VFZ01_08625 [Geminicoccaceae bacterium]
MLHRWIFLAIWLGALIGAGWLLAFAEPSIREAVLREGGPIEGASAIGYTVTAAWLLSGEHARRAGVRPLAFLLLLCTARELDMQHAFTSGSVSKVSYFLDPRVAGLEKILVVAVLVACGLIAVRALALLPPLMRDFRAGRPHACSTMGVLVLLPFTKMLDGLHRTLRDTFGFAIEKDTRAMIGAFEENLELAASLTVLLALAQHRALARRVRSSGAAWHHERERLVRSARA